MKDVFIGVDLGGTKVIACVLSISKKFKVLGKAKQPTKAWEGKSKVFNRIEESLRIALDKSKTSLKKIDAIGIGVPGAVHVESGNISLASNLGWKDVNLKKELEKRFKLPVYINNDVNLGTLAEQTIGVAKNAQSVVGIYWGTGIGGGIVVDGKIVQGSSSTAGEIGHMIVAYNGKKCTCGRRGCFESYAAKWSLTENVYQRIKNGEKSLIEFKGDKPREEILKSKQIKKAFLADDKVLKEELVKSTQYFGMGLANIVNMLNPEFIVIGGGMIESMEDQLMPLICESLENHKFPSAEYKIKTAKLGDYSVLAGAAYFARQKLA
ncbi:MAG: ROK family protein [Calditrichaceae bacterium]